jgi:hypothetical protein
LASLVKREMYFEWSAANHRVKPHAHDHNDNDDNDDNDDNNDDDDDDDDDDDEKGNASGPRSSDGFGFSKRSCRMSGTFDQLHGVQARSLDHLLRSRAPGKLGDVCTFR